jgi:hypothetical protein
MPLADIAFLVRSAPVSGPFGGGTDGLLSAHKATYAAQQGPSLFDHLVGEREQLCRKFEPERLCGLEIEHKPQLRGSLYR